MEIEPYPFDKHLCRIQIAGISRNVLKLEVGRVSVIDGPEGFFKPNELAPRAYLGNPIFHSQDKSCYADTCRPGEVEDDDPSFRPRVDFRLSFVRDPSYVFLTYVLVGWAFNMIAFSAFWFPRGSSVDRAGLSIGGIITAQFMLYDAKVTVKWVWLDTYLMARRPASRSGAAGDSRRRRGDDSRR